MWVLIEKLSNFFNIVLGSSQEFNIRIYRIVYYLLTVLLTINTILSFANNRVSEGIIILTMLIIMSITVFYAITTRSYRWGNIVFVVTIFIIGLSALFITQGGLKGPWIAMFVFGMGYTVFCIEGTLGFVFVGIEAIVYLIDMYIVTTYPSLTDAYEPSYVKVAFPTVVTGLILAFTVGLQFRTYMEQQKYVVELNEKYHRLYRHDALTDLYNRRGFIEEEEKNRLVGVPESYTVMLFDIDYFKQVNDQYGHYVGDLVLQKVAETALEIVKGNGIICRWGGEEFAVIIPNEERALDISEKLRATVEALTIEKKDIVVNVTISVGLAVYRYKLPSMSSITNDADNALYDAKEQGRNRVVTVYL